MGKTGSLACPVRAVRPHAPRQRCQAHFLGNVAEEVSTGYRLTQANACGFGWVAQKQGLSRTPVFFLVPAPEHAPACLELEGQLRTAIRDAVNRTTRKPFYGGGLKGYQQLASIARNLHALPLPKTAYWVRLLRQVDRTLENNRPLAEMLATTYTWFLRIAVCLRYPPSTYPEAPRPTRLQVKQEMEDLLRSFAAEACGQAIPWALYSGLRKRWELFADDLLHCFDIPGCPRTTSRSKAWSATCVVVNAASADENPPNPCVSLVTPRSAARRIARNNFSNNCSGYPWLTIANSVNAKHKPKLHVNS